MKKLILFVFCLALASGTAFAGFGTQEDGVYEGEAGIVNASTNLDSATDNNVQTLSVSAAPSFATSVTAPKVIVTYYATLPYYSKLTMIGSGAPAGSMLIRGGDGNNCGNGGDGTTLTVCASDGTNWRKV